MAADDTKPGEPESVAKETADATVPADPETVAKEADAPAEPQEPVAKDDAEGKAKMVAVFDSKGDLVGVCDPGDITPIAGADAPAANEEEPPAADKPAEPEAPPADPADLTPAPAADAGTPADDVAKETASGLTEDAQAVLKSLIEDAVRQALGTAAVPEGIAKSDAALSAEEVEVLKARIKALEEQPAMPKVFTNGAVPPAGALRGQDRPATGLPQVDVAKAAGLKNTLYRGTAAEQNAAAREMQEAAIAGLSAIHATRRG